MHIVRLAIHVKNLLHHHSIGGSCSHRLNENVHCLLPVLGDSRQLPFNDVLHDIAHAPTNLRSPPSSCPSSLYNAWLGPVVWPWSPKICNPNKLVRAVVSLVWTVGLRSDGRLVCTTRAKSTHTEHTSHDTCLCVLRK